MKKKLLTIVLVSCLVIVMFANVIKPAESWGGYWVFVGETNSMSWMLLFNQGLVLDQPKANWIYIGILKFFVYTRYEGTNIPYGYVGKVAVELKDLSTGQQVMWWEGWAKSPEYMVYAPIVDYNGPLGMDLTLRIYAKQTYGDSKLYVQVRDLSLSWTSWYQQPPFALVKDPCFQNPNLWKHGQFKADTGTWTKIEDGFSFFVTRTAADDWSCVYAMSGQGSGAVDENGLFYNNVWLDTNVPNGVLLASVLLKRTDFPVWNGGFPPITVAPSCQAAMGVNVNFALLVKHGDEIGWLNIFSTDAESCPNLLRSDVFADSWESLLGEWRPYCTENTPLCVLDNPGFLASTHDNDWHFSRRPKYMSETGKLYRFYFDYGKYWREFNDWYNNLFAQILKWLELKTRLDPCYHPQDYTPIGGVIANVGVSAETVSASYGGEVCYFQIWDYRVSESNPVTPPLYSDWKGRATSFLPEHNWNPLPPPPPPPRQWMPRGGYWWIFWSPSLWVYSGNGTSLDWTGRGMFEMWGLGEDKVAVKSFGREATLLDNNTTIVLDLRESIPEWEPYQQPGKQPTMSFIDQIEVYAIDQNDTMHKLTLSSALLNDRVDVSEAILNSDNNRVQLSWLNNIKLKYKINPVDPDEIKGFVMFVEGFSTTDIVAAIMPWIIVSIIAVAMVYLSKKIYDFIVRIPV